MTEREIAMQAGERQHDMPIPHWTIRIFTGAALVLVPWTVWVFASLPPSHVDHRWNLAWAGFDGALLAALALTAYLAWRKSSWLVVAATVSATLLLSDAWFDILTSNSGADYAFSLVSAVGVELPLAGLSLWIALRAGRQFFSAGAAGAYRPESLGHPGVVNVTRGVAVYADDGSALHADRLAS
jgi:hypothetical protein